MATREEEIRVKVTGAQAAERDLDRFGDAADDAGKHVGILGKESSGAAKKVDELGDEAKGTERELSKLEHQAVETAVAVKRLNDQHVRGTDGKVVKGLQDQEREYTKLAKAGKRLADIDLSGGKGKGLFADVKGILSSGASQAGQIGGQVGQTVGSSNLLTGAAIGAGAAGLPVLGAAAGGAVIAGAGIGAVGGGIAGALGGPGGNAIKAEFSALVADLSGNWHKATADWWQPLIAGEKELHDAVNNLPLDEIFGNARKFIEPLSKGIAGFTEAIGRGANTLVREAGPVIDAFAEELPKLGKNIENAMDAIAAGAPGAAKGLSDVLSVTGSLIEATGVLIYGFESLYDKASNTPVLKQGHQAFMDMFGGDTQDAVTQVGMSLDGAASAGDRMASSGKDVADAWGGADKAMQDSANTADRLFNAQVGLIESDVRWAQAKAELSKSIADNGRAWDVNTQKGRDNTNALLDAIRAAKAHYDAMLADGQSQAAASAAYNASIGALQAQALAAGLTAKQFDAMTAALRNYLSTPANKTVTTTIRTVGSVSSEGVTSGGDQRGHTGKAYAAGGDVSQTGWSLVGENGPELRWLNKGDQITNATQTRQMMSGGVSMGQAAQALPPMGVLEQALAALLMKLANSGQLQIPSRAVV